ncbi:hypothetical protein ACU8OJ_25280 (plasmid) [Rhizobium leguminosarum]
MAELTSNERKALCKLDIETWENKAQLYVGDKTISHLLELVYIERMRALPSGTERFKITREGRTAIHEPVLAKPKKKPGLKTLAPRLTTLPPRLK